MNRCCAISIRLRERDIEIRQQQQLGSIEKTFLNFSNSMRLRGRRCCSRAMVQSKIKIVMLVQLNSRTTTATKLHILIFIEDWSMKYTAHKSTTGEHSALRWETWKLQFFISVLLLQFFIYYFVVFRCFFFITTERFSEKFTSKLSLESVERASSSFQSKCDLWLLDCAPLFFDGVRAVDLCSDLFTCDRVPCQSSCFSFVVALVAMVNRYQVDSLWASKQKIRETQHQLQKCWRNLTSRIRSTEKISIECEKSTSAHNAHTTCRVSAEMMGKYLDKTYFCCEKQIVSVLKWNLLFARTNLYIMLCKVQVWLVRDESVHDMWNINKLPASLKVKLRISFLFAIPPLCPTSKNHRLNSNSRKK